MNFPKWISPVALCVSCGIAGSAQAAELGWYVVAFGGESSAQNVSQGDLDNTLINDFGSVGLTIVDATSSLDDSDTGFGLAAGYQVSDYFAAELAYVDLGDITYDAAGTVTDGVVVSDMEATLSQSADGPVISLLGIVPVGNSRFSVYGRLGLALMNVDADIGLTLGGTPANDSASTTRSNAVYGVGVEYGIGDRFGVRVEWDRYADVGSEELAGDIDVDLITLGLRYNFR